MIKEYITKLGFSEEAGRLYGALVAKGPLTALEASREASLERTSVYRMIEDLTAKGLIEEVLEHKSRRVRAVPPERIQRMIAEEKRRVSELENGFGEFERTVSQASGVVGTQVRYYRGVSGIKQIMWNETKAEKEILGYTYRNMEEIAGVKFFKEWVAEIEKNGIISRDLRSDEFLVSMERPGYERVHIDKSSWRYLPEKVMSLSHNLDIYNDVVAIYYWEENDVFGVEIQNQKMADTQRSIWETMWKLAEEYKLPKKYQRIRGQSR